MSGIAEVLLNLGYEVSGSDLKLSRGHRAPAAAGRARSSRGTAPRTSGDADVVVTSPAVHDDNPEVAEPRGPQDPGDPPGRDAGRADADEVRHRASPAPTARPPPPPWSAQVLTEAGLDPTW